MKKTLVLFFLLIGAAYVLHGQDIFDAARKGDTTRIKLLVKLNPDTVNTKNASGFTPLILAGYYNQVDAAALLLNCGATINTTSPEGPVLLAACYKGYVKLAKLLITHHADVNACNESGTTALMYAVMANNVELVKLLLANGARKDLKEKSGNTAMNYAKLKGSAEITTLVSQ